MTWATAPIIGSLAAQAEVVVQQNINLRYGWNAVCVEVAPTQSPDELFASWPVKSVGFYDPASFLSTRQFAQKVKYGDCPHMNGVGALVRS